MRILLLGEYSNVHATLAQGLRSLGHSVTVASNGDFWKDYPRDIDLQRHSGPLAGARLYLKILLLLPRFTGYDIVQIINPMFFELTARRLFPIFKFLRHHNRKVVLGAFGMDYYWVNENITRLPLRYSDFNIGSELRTDKEAMAERQDWIGTDKERLNRYLAEKADAIVSGLYEYDVCYRPHFPDKTTFIPFPIVVGKEVRIKPVAEKITIFIGISRNRSAYKGTDIMLHAAEKILARHPDKVRLIKVEGLPFSDYRRRMLDADIILDQLYSYTPAMNALEAMSHGIVCVGGGEPENYTILGEEDLRPIVNVEPCYESVAVALERLISDREWLETMKRQSVEYVRRHHDHMKVARRYEALYRHLLGNQ